MSFITESPAKKIQGFIGQGWLWSNPEVTIVGRDDKNKIINEGTGEIVKTVKDKDYYVVELYKLGTKGEKIQQSIPSYKLIKGDFEKYKKSIEGVVAVNASWDYNKFSNI